MNNFILYKTSDNKVSINVQIQDETVWLTQEQMAEVFSKSKPTINEHVKNIYTEKELSEEAENVETFVGKNSGEERIRFIVRDSERILKPEEFEGAKLHITQKVNMKGEVVGETFSIEKGRQ